jgi:hypothetical protein
MCSIKVGVSPFWKPEMSHSASSWPLVGPPFQMAWQQTMMRWLGDMVMDDVENDGLRQWGQNMG